MPVILGKRGTSTLLVATMSLLMLLSMASVAQAPTQYTRYPTDDSYVIEWIPNSTHGQEQSVFVAYLSPTMREWAYLKFDLSGVSGPINSAKLKLFCMCGGKFPYPETIELWSTTDTWNENTINWVNKPLPSSNLATCLVDGVGYWYSWQSPNLLAYINQELAGDDVLSLVLIMPQRQTSAPMRSFCSDEATFASHGPRLELAAP